MSWLNRWTDEDLVCVYGDSPLFDEHARELERRFRKRILSRIRREIHDPNSREDVLAQVWQKVLTGKHTFIPGGMGSASRWLFGITRNEIANHFRRGTKLPAGLEDGSGETVPVPEPRPEAVCQQQEDVERACRAIWGLPAEAQTILVLTKEGQEGKREKSFAFGELTKEETAALLGCSELAVINRSLERSWKEVRAKLRVTPNP
jgi:RNA polymerase sigma factor (sigma-70 family)